MFGVFLATFDLNGSRWDRPGICSGSQYLRIIPHPLGDSISMIKGKSILITLTAWTVLLLGSTAYAATLTVTSPADDTDPGTLRNTIAAAKANDTIVFDPSLAGQTIALNASRQSLIVNKNLTVDGGSLSITVDARGGPFSVFSNVTGIAGIFTVRGLTITGSGAGSQGGIRCSQSSALVVADCHIVGNQQGGIFAEGPLTVVRTDVSNNVSSVRDGAAGITVYGHGGGVSMTITDCVIANNSGSAGGIFSRDGVHATISRTRIDHNTANLRSAGAEFDSDFTFESCSLSFNSGPAMLLFARRSRLVVQNTQISNNLCRLSSVRVLQGSLTIGSCQISHNTGSEGSDGVIFNDMKGLAVISDTIIDDNDGLGLALGSGEARLDNCRITNNRHGGILNYGTMRLNRCLVQGNSLRDSWIFGGGGIYNNSNFTADECIISDNTARLGGGIAIRDYLFAQQGYSITTLNNCTLSGNIATIENGGGINAYNQTHNGLSVILTNCTISGNTARNGKGGGIYLESVTGLPSLVDFLSSTIANNNALGSGASGIGGGLYLELRPNAIVTVNSTIVALNHDEQNFSPDFFGSVTNDLGFNLVGKSDGSAGFDNSVLIGTIDDPIDPVLGNLADNGGPTMTQALLVNSPAIGSGNPQFAGQRDQRGVRRRNPNDIGAYYAGIRAVAGGQMYRGRVTKNVR